MSRAWSRIGPIREAADRPRPCGQLCHPTFFAETGPAVADTELEVVEELARLTGLHNPWIAAAALFGDGP
jgi:hypothetical protein